MLRLKFTRHARAPISASRSLKRRPVYDFARIAGLVIVDAIAGRTIIIRLANLDLVGPFTRLQVAFAQEIDASRFLSFGHPLHD